MICLFWLPLGSGGAGLVRMNGRMFEAVQARAQKRPALDLYHAALEVRLQDARFVIEMAPAWGRDHGQPGVVSQGPVGLRWLGRSRFFRYEVRRWRDGRIPDLGEAVGGPHLVSDDPSVAQAVLDLVPCFPTGTWGRDEYRTGDMWNSNSLVAWLLARGGVDTAAVAPPPHGRAPGWSAGLVVAARQRPPAQTPSTRS
jgi:hypothetical protein